MTQKEFDALYENSKFAQQLNFEIIEGLEQGIGLIVGAAMRQLDSKTFANDLRAQIGAAKMLHSTPTLAIRVATHALAAAEADQAFPHPAKR